MLLLLNKYNNCSNSSKQNFKKILEADGLRNVSKLIFIDIITSHTESRLDSKITMLHGDEII